MGFRHKTGTEIINKLSSLSLKSKVQSLKGLKLTIVKYSASGPPTTTTHHPNRNSIGIGNDVCHTSKHYTFNFFSL